MQQQVLQKKMTRLKIKFNFNFLVVRGSCHSGYKKCDHHCIEIIIGQGECRCKPKFKLDNDGRSCKGKTWL